MLILYHLADMFGDVKLKLTLKNNSIANDSQHGNNTIVPIINLITGNQVMLIMLSLLRQTMQRFMRLKIAPEIMQSNRRFE